MYTRQFLDYHNKKRKLQKIIATNEVLNKNDNKSFILLFPALRCEIQKCFQGQLDIKKKGVKICEQILVSPTL